MAYVYNERTGEFTYVDDNPSSSSTNRPTVNNPRTPNNGNNGNNNNNNDGCLDGCLDSVTGCFDVAGKIFILMFKVIAAVIILSVILSMCS